MALSPTEESLVRQLIAQNPALLNLASSESTIISKLGATKVSLSDLSAATSLSDADLALVRQGLNDKSFAMSVLRDYVAANLPVASTTTKGIVELATNTETQTGTDAVRAVTPAGLASVTATETRAGLLEIATTAEAQALTDDVRALTPKKLADSGAVFAGDVRVFAGAIANIPSGYLLCDNSAISRTTYARLFAAIGTTYGAGNGTTTFNLPELRGEFIRGLDNARGVDAGRTLGSGQTDEIKSHDHATGLFAVMSGSSGSAHVNGAGSGKIQATGGVETRPRNVAMNYIIKY